MNQFQRIYCPVDFSVYSQRALSYAVSLGIHYGAQLLAHHVLVPVQSAYYGYMVPGTIGQEYERNVYEQAVGVMHEFVKTVVQERIDCEEILSVGSSTREILSCADNRHADLIVMGTHGRSGFERFMLGSVTEKVIRKAHCPVLAVREMTREPVSGSVVDDAIHYRRILVPVDLTEHSSITLNYAVGFATRYRARLTILYVVERHAVPIVDPTFATLPPNYWSDVSEEANRHLARLVQATNTQGLEVAGKVTWGRIGEEIVRAARHEQVDLIIMGARDSWIANVVSIGTTAHQVMIHAECPLLLLRGR